MCCTHPAISRVTGSSLPLYGVCCSSKIRFRFFHSFFIGKLVVLRFRDAVTDRVVLNKFIIVQTSAHKSGLFRSIQRAYMQPAVVVTQNSASIPSSVRAISPDFSSHSFITLTAPFDAYASDSAQQRADAVLGIRQRIGSHIARQAAAVRIAHPHSHPISPPHPGPARARLG